MPIYKQRGNILISIKEKPTDLEKTTQHIMENNLQEIFGLDFVCTEFPLNNFRIDTLAFDAETKSFVIIDQGESINAMQRHRDILQEVKKIRRQKSNEPATPPSTQ